MSKSKKETIKYLTDLMGVVAMAYFKGRALGVQVHESPLVSSAAICIDLYHFEGDGKPVCEGLNPCVITCDDGFTMTGNVFCMCYDPEDEVTPLVFEFEGDEDYQRVMEIDPEDMPEQSLKSIVAWLEKAMKPAEPEKFRNDVTSFMFYMWNKWSEEECKIAFKDGDYNHFWNKWCEAYDTMKGPRGAAELFYMMLSDTNRDKLVKRALECYDGMSEKN